MCGICGIATAQPQAPVDAETLTRMTDLLRHRGPDSEGAFREPGIGLGVRRLSIVDLDTGDQPIMNEDRSVIVVCNGEIYNHVELRRGLEAAGHRFRTRSDVEVIVHLYEDAGDACVESLRGMFAFALWDRPRRRLLLARDRLGIKPLLYVDRAEGLVFASELKSILQVDGIEPEIEPAALEDLFTLGFVAGPHTLCRGVLRLMPGHVLTYRDGRSTIRRYWEIPFPPRDEPPAAPGGNGRRRRVEDAWAEALRATLEETVRLHLRSDVPVGAWLSGGLDSSAVVALMARGLDQPIATMSLGFEEPTLDEVGETRTLDEFPGYDLRPHRAVCRTRDLERFPEALWHSEDPTTTGNEIPRLLLSELSARHVKVVLTGEGADEVLGGYWWYRLDGRLRPLARLPLTVRRALAPAGVLRGAWPYGARLFRAPRVMGLTRWREMIGPRHQESRWDLLAPDVAAVVRAARGPDREPPSGFARWHPFHQIQHWDMTTRLPDFIVHKLDRLSMAHSLEARVPFLDHELVELCARMPPSVKLKRGREKDVLRRAMRDILPPEILRRKKRGLAAPYRQWLRGPLPAFAAELLSPGRVRADGVFDAAAVARLLTAHRSGQEDYGEQIQAVLGVQLWRELFCGGGRPAAPPAGRTP